MTIAQLAQHPSAVFGPRVAAAQPLDESQVARRLESSTELATWVSCCEAAPEALLVINDSHRSTCTREVLTALATLLGRQSASPSFRVLVATGTHRISNAEQRHFESRTILDCGLRISAVAWHDARSECLAPFAGVRVHPWLVELDCWLAVGSVEPHYFAGLTGAHKTATIGCMSKADIESNHRGALHPGSDVLCLHGNPVHEGIAQVLREFSACGKHLLAINEIVAERHILELAVGDPLSTLELLLPQVRSVYVHAVPGPADLLLLHVPMPLGRSLYQADKALKNNHRAVRDGGAILLEADCPDGVGDDAFLGLLDRAPDYASACRLVEQEGYRLGDHKAVKLRHLTDPLMRGVRVAVVSANLSDELARRAGLRAFADRAEALQWLAGACSGSMQNTIVVNDAGFVVVMPAENGAPNPGPAADFNLHDQ